MDRTIFFAALRGRSSGLFGTSLSSQQVAGCEAILDAGKHLPIQQLAYVLATPYHETKRKMWPNRENLYYTTAARLVKVWPSRFNHASANPFLRNPQALACEVYNGRLGNRPGTLDGWVYRGNGLGHTTGRDNHRKASEAVGVDLVAKPERLLDIKIAAEVLATEMETGRNTGHRLADFIGPNGYDYYNARSIQNADKRANGELVAKYARAFEAALRAAGYAPAAIHTPTPPATAKGGLAALISAIMAILKGRGK